MVTIQTSRLTDGGVPARRVVVVDPAGRLVDVVKADYELPAHQTVEGFAVYWAKLTGDQVARGEVAT